MPVPAYSPALLSTAWDKIKGAADKPTGVADALKALKKAHDAIDAGLLDPAKATEAPLLAARLSAVEAEQRGALKALADQQAKLALLVKKWEPEFKKAGAAGKAATTGIATVDDEAKALVAAWTRGLQGARDTLAEQVQKASAATKASAKDAPKDATKDAKPADLSALPEFKAVKSKVMESLRAVRAGGGGPEAPKIEFVACLSAQGCTVYMGKTASTSHRPLVQALQPGASGFKFHYGQCIWENKTWTFVGDDVPSGLAKRLQAALKTLTGAKFAVRARRPGGEPDEAEGDAAALEALADEVAASAAPGALPATTAPPSPAADAADPKVFAARATEIAALIAAAIKAGHPHAAMLKVKLSETLALGKTPARLAGAAKALEMIAKAVGGGAPGGATKSGIGFDEARWKQAQQQWQQHVEAADGQIAAVRDRMLAIGTPDLRRIADRGLPALTSNHKTPVMRALIDVGSAQGDARAAALARAAEAVAAFRAHLREDRMIRVLEENATTAFGVPLTLRSEVGAGLDAVQSAIDAVTA